MSTPSQKPIPLIHEQPLLQHVARYGITVREAVAKSVLPNESPAQIRRTLNGLVRSGVLVRGHLYRNRRYFSLTEKGREIAGAGAGVTWGPLSESVKIRGYAMLAFCCLSAKPREALTPVEFQTHFSDLYRPGLTMNYYIDTAGRKSRLGFLRIDTGGQGRWDRIIAKARHDSHRHWASKEFRSLIESGAFEITIVTALPQKAQRIQSALADAKHKLRTNMNVVAVPDLLHLILPPPVSASKS